MADLESLAGRVGGAVRQRRAALGLTQARLAELAGMTSDEVSRIERGAREPRFDTVARLAVALELDPGALFAAAGTPPPQRPPRQPMPVLAGADLHRVRQGSFMDGTTKMPVEPPPVSGRGARFEAAAQGLPDDVVDAFIESVRAVRAAWKRSGRSPR